MPYFILFVLTVASALAGFISNDAGTVLCGLTALPMLFIAGFTLFTSEKKLPANVGYWLATCAVVFFSTSTGDSLAEGSVGWTSFMALVAIFWIIRTVVLARKMDGLNDTTPQEV